MFGRLTKANHPTTTTAPRRAKLTLDALEDRLVMSSTIINGDLYIYGNNANNTVTVVHETHSGVGYYKVTENGANTYHRASLVTGGDIGFYGYDGDDYFRNDTGLKAFAWGMGGNDTLVGGNNHDTLDGGLGSDYLYGNRGVDTMYAGYDYSYNYLHGGSDADWMYGGWGVDHMYGDWGNDRLYGSWGNDYLHGGDGTDSLFGEYGDDTLVGHADNDYLYGGFGNDVLSGGTGTDTLYGEAGDDRLDGGQDGSYDRLYGGTGADKFKKENYRLLFWWYNRDEPRDFSRAERDFYFV